MADQSYKIFYSWQSDLPAKDTRNIIEDSIKYATKVIKDSATVIADRDTKGVTGSPDILRTLLKKIDECDVFVADVTPVTTYHPLKSDGSEDLSRVKAVPNANVMLELGYATQILPWENIVCIMNDDYSGDGEVPFDVAHHRFTHFSLKDKEKSDVKKELSGYIIDAIFNVMENGKRAKGEFSNIKVGSYDMETDQVLQYLKPIDLHLLPSVADFLDYYKAKARTLIDEIKNVSLPKIDIRDEKSECSTDKKEAIIMEDGTVLTPVVASKFNLFGKKDIVITDKDKEFSSERVMELFDIELDDEFFNMGNLKATVELRDFSWIYIDEGTKEEKEKHEKYLELNALLAKIDSWISYIATFDEYMLIPLAVSNESSVSDKEIKVYVEVDSNTADVVEPTADIIHPKLKGLEGYVYEEDYVELTLKMEESTKISYGYDITSSMWDLQNDAIVKLNGAGINGNPRYSEEDYEKELKKYIASPIGGNPHSFEFTVGKLHAREKKWIGPMLLLKPIGNQVKISYSIKSVNSDGTLGRNLCTEKEDAE